MKNSRTGIVARTIAVVILLATVLFVVYKSDWFQKKYIYPYPYREIVEKYSARNSVDPLLVISIMKAESKFDPDANSGAGAIGLMQLMPESALWIAGQIGEQLEGVSSLENPETSIKLGSWYIASLLDENKGNLVLALAAYNAGRGNVSFWIKDKNWSNDFADSSRIPFKETREFVRRVVSNYENYKKLYRNEIKP